MKKVLALVLAVMMMATVAFAAKVEVNTPPGDVTAGGGQYKPGGKIKIDMTSIMNDAGTNVYDSDPDSSAVVNGTSELIKKINSSNYSITNIKYDEGKNLVESVSFADADNQVVVKLKEDFTNTSKKTLNMTFKLKGKKVGNSKKPNDIELHIRTTVGYQLIDGDTSITNSAGETKHYYVQFGSNDATLELDNPGEVVLKFKGSSASYATLNLTADDPDIEAEFRVYDGDKLFLYSEIDADTDVLKAYADTDAEITFLNFTGTPTLNSTATVRFYKDEGTYFYINNDGKLVDINGTRASGSAMDLTSKVRWDEDEGCYILKTRTLGSYVMSDKKLNVAAGSTADNIGATTNPDTGANDVVGIATALAAVALVSAAAVSLKK